MAEDKTSKKMYTFTVIDGEHQGFAKAYKKGETFQSEYPLDKMFIGKFSRGSDTVVVDVKKPVSTRMTFVFSDADDVTEQFPLAKENKLRVFKDAMGGHAVATLDDDNGEPVNVASSIMGSKQAVNKWLIDYSKR